MSSNQVRTGKRCILSSRQWDQLGNLYSLHRQKNPRLSLRAFRHTLIQQSETLLSGGGVPTEIPSERAFQKHLKSYATPYTCHEWNNPASNGSEGIHHTTQNFVEYGCGHYQTIEFSAYVHEKWPNYNHTICPTCQTAKSCLVDRALHDEALLTAMKQNFGTLKLEWRDEGPNVHGISLQNLATKMPSKVRDCKDFKKFLSGSVKIRCIHLDVNPPSTQAQKAVEGGMHPEHFNYPTEQLIRNPGDGSIGLVSWKNGTSDPLKRDYIFIGNLGVTNECIKSICLEETRHMQNMAVGKRYGAAGGFLVPSQKRCFDTKSMSKCTKTTREFVKAPESTSTACAIAYNNIEKNKEVVYGTCYKDILMCRLEPDQKAKRLQTIAAEQEKTIKEMEHRLKCLLAVEYLSLEQPSAIWSDFKKVATSVSNPSIVRKWGNVSLWHCVLLEWASRMPEIRNHQALAAHVDGNRLNFLQSMTLFGKVATNANESSSSLVRSMVKGILCCPLQGVAVEIECGRDALQMQLANTVHVPDRTRGQKNWSWVQGSHNK